MVAYKLVVYWSDVDEAYLVEIPDLPGCCAKGRSFQDALENAEAAIQEWLKDAQRIDRRLSKPTSIIMHHPFTL